MSNNIKKTYGRSVFLFEDFINKIIKKKRLEINDIFFLNIKITNKTTLLDVGTTSSLNKHQNLLIKEYPFKKNITCFSNQNLIFLKKKMPEVKIKKGDGKKMKFKDNSFDVVASSATIEHVGSNQDQIRFVQECYRVSRKYFFLTTPNRWFPIEMHVRFPLIHYFPKPFFRKILKLFGQNFLAEEKNLNLLTKYDIINILNFLRIKKFIIKKVHLFGFCSNYIFIIKK